MQASQGIKSITIQRKIIRANGLEEPEEVVAYWDTDPGVMERVLASGGALLSADGSVVPKAREMHPVTPSDTLLAMTREQLERSNP